MSATKAETLRCACLAEFLSCATQEDADNGEACCGTCYAEIAAEWEGFAEGTKAAWQSGEYGSGDSGARSGLADAEAEGQADAGYQANLSEPHPDTASGPCDCTACEA